MLPLRDTALIAQKCFSSNADIYASPNACIAAANTLLIMCSTAQKTLYKRATIHAHNSFFLDEFETNYPHQPECMLTLSRRAGLSSQSGARLPNPLLLRAPDFSSMGEIV